MSDLPQISGYDLLGRIGEGGMGTIYLAEEKSLARRVAIKVVSGKLATDSQARARFLREARSLATVEHANVVRIYAFGEVDGQPYLAMQYVEGETLAERIRREGKLAVEDALRITREILIALEAAWEKGIVHRDIKPSNVLLDRRGHVHVADFGLAKATQASEDLALTASGHVLGTPYYVAPEQAQGKATDFRADIYSCGILLYEMLAGERPFEGTTPFAIVAKHIGEPMPPIQAKRPDVSPRVAKLLEQMSAKSPDRRPASYRDLITELETLVGITPHSMRSATLPAAPLPDDFRRTALAATLILIVLTAAGVTLYRLMPKTRTASDPAFAAADRRMVVAVTPFYGPDADSTKEGRVMAALVERSIGTRLGSENVKIAGIDETKEPVRNHEAARVLGQRLGAAVVVWGEAFALRNETEIQPYFTLVRQRRATTGVSAPSTSRDVDLKSADPLAQLGEQSSSVVRLETETPNQIDVRKTSAEGVGEMVSFLAAIHALYEENDHSKALRFFGQAPATADVLRHRAQAYLRADDRANAMKSLEEAMRLDPQHIQGRANLADLYLLDNRFADAVAAYTAVAASGQPFTTTQGIVSGGRLYRRELYRNPASSVDEIVDGATLLAVNPTTGETVGRYRLPGVVRSFTPAPHGFTLSYEADRKGSHIERLSFANGQFDRPLHMGGNLLLRMKTMRAGWVIPNNFLGDITGIIQNQPAAPRFRLSGTKVDDDLPKTLPDLEAALRAAYKRDPTQPWHLFFLGQALQAQGKTIDAGRVWTELATKDFAGVPYTNYNWMAKYFERYGQRAWADRLYDKGLRERRRLAQPVIGSTLIERLINVSFMRVHPAQLQDADRAYTWLVRAREISGVAEADNYAAAAWAGWFRRQGDGKRAAIEKQYADASARDPLNFTSDVTLVDYAIYLYVAALCGFIMTTLILLGRAVSMARATQGRSLRSALRRVLGRDLPSPWSAVVLGLEIAVAGLVAIGLKADLGWAEVAFVAFVTLAIAGILLPAVRPITAIRLMQRRDRLTIAVLFALFIVAHFALLTAYRRISAFAAIDIGIADSLGHPGLVRSFEERLARRSTPEARYVTAVANELAGNRARADELYAQLPNDARAAAARGKLDQPRRVIVPTGAEITAVYSEPWRPLPRKSGAISGETRISITSIAVFLSGVTLLILFVGLKRAESARLHSRAHKFLYLFVPGAYDLRHGSAPRGALLTVLTGFVIWLAVAMRYAFPVHRSAGVLTAKALPNIKAAFPFPPVESAMDLMLAPIYATQFWTFAILATTAWLVLHCMRIPAILRQHADA